VITLRVSPAPTGTEADYRSVEFWDAVAAELAQDDVTVVFRAGEYLDAAPVHGTRDRLGDPTHLLTLTAEEAGATVFRIPTDAVDQSRVPCLERSAATARFQLRDAQNVSLSGMAFTGPGTIGYVVRVRGQSDNVTISDCTFEELPGVQYGATGAADPLTKNVVLERCVFRNVGCDAHAHMMYNAYGAHHLAIRACRFEECAGDYVRFRAGVDHCVVERSTFVHRGDIYPSPRPFIAAPLFNDCKPGSERCPDPLEHPQYEYFGTHFTIKENAFDFRVGGDRAFVLDFLHSGWDPPRRFHLLTEPEGRLLEGGTDAERRTILGEHFGIDMSEVKFYENSASGERYLAALESYAAFGATSPRWEAFGRWEANGATAVDISDLLNADDAAGARWLEAVTATVL
jgi:hypothetical protein